MTYNNPIIPGFYPDPSICKAPDGYYLVTSTFEFFPGVPIFHSKDLVNWRQIGHCLTRKSQLDLEGIAASKGIYAPTIRYHKGLFYMVTTNRRKIGNFYVTATDPAGEWSEPIPVELGGIDPSLFWDDDDTCYFISNAEAPSGQRFMMGPIDTETGKFTSPPQPMWRGAGGQAPEAPHIYKKDGYYYQMNAEGGTELGHSITIARSRGLFGPWEECPSNPILTHKHRKGELVQATGHGDLTCDDDGNWWIVFLGYRQTAKYFHHLGRETFLAPVKWVDGWPVINDNQTIKTVMNVDINSGATQQNREPLFADFSSGRPLEWIHLRNPAEDNYRYGSALSLLGSKYNLSDIANPTFLGIRQTDLNSCTSVTLTFNPEKDNEEAGISAFYKYDSHYDLCLTHRNGKRAVMLRKVVGDIRHIEAVVPIRGNSATFVIETDSLNYRFYLKDDDDCKLVGEGISRLLSTEAHDLGFTGVILALYASGNGSNAQKWAHFSDFSYEGFDWVSK